MPAIKKLLIVGMFLLGLMAIVFYFSYAKPTIHTRNPIAHQKGFNAFWALDKTYSQSAINYAQAEIEQGEQMDPDEPWLLIARARLYLTLGYKSYNNTDKEAVNAAFNLAERAAKIAPNDPIILSFYANRLYDTGKNEKAWELLQQAMKKDPKSAYPFYCVADKIAEARDAKSLATWIETAKAVDIENRYNTWKLSLERNLCYLNKDDACVEQKFHESITLEPENPWHHGNFANFLKREKRYPEAKLEYEKALALMEYPMARQELIDLEKRITAEKVGQD